MRFRKFLKPYKTRDSSFREYTISEGGYSSIYHEKVMQNKLAV